jgi:hypothetical protein
MARASEAIPGGPCCILAGGVVMRRTPTYWVEMICEEIKTA